MVKSIYEIMLAKVMHYNHAFTYENETFRSTVNVMNRGDIQCPG